VWTQLKTAVVAALIGGIAATATVAVAGSGVGGVFNLGQSNTVNTSSALAGTAAGKQQLVVANLATAPSSGALFGYGKSASPAATFQNAGAGPALSLVAGAGQPPFTTNSAYRVPNLNADKLDGLDSTQVMRGNSYAARTTLGALDGGVDSTNPNILTIPGLGTFGGTCRLATFAQGQLEIDPASDATLTFTFAGADQPQEGALSSSFEQVLFVVDFVLAKGEGPTADVARGTVIMSPFNGDQSTCRFTVTAERAHA
jgi:hypothetical protein